jgi:hypothetical protein
VLAGVSGRDSRCRRRSALFNRLGASGRTPLRARAWALWETSPTPTTPAATSDSLIDLDGIHGGDFPATCPMLGTLSGLLAHLEDCRSQRWRPSAASLLRRAVGRTKAERCGSSPPCPARQGVPFGDPLTGTWGVVDSDTVVEHDSRRKPFPLRTSTRWVNVHLDRENAHAPRLRMAAAHAVCGYYETSRRTDATPESSSQEEPS